MNTLYKIWLARWKHYFEGSNEMRVVFVNLHSDWMLVKAASVYIFKFSAAIKHGYLLKYLLEHPEYEVCNYINDRGFSTLRNDN